MALEPAFLNKINYKILVKTVCIGVFDGVEHDIAAATTAGKVFLYRCTFKSSPGGAVKDDSANVKLLNINKEVRCLAAGRVKANADRDILAIGTSNSVLVYDVFNNADVFSAEVADGVNAIAIGRLGCIPQTLVVIGGNCVAQGFNAKGEELFWTVTGDNVCSLVLCDYTGNGLNELIIGSDGFDIRVYRDDEVIFEITETEAITHLHAISRNRFAYALANGTLGVYEGPTRLWRIKSKNHVTSLVTYDVDDCGEVELIAGWSNGKIDYRRVDNGEVLIKEQLGSCISGIVISQHTEAQFLVLCTMDGDIRGYRSLGKGGRVVAIQSAPMPVKKKPIAQFSKQSSTAGPESETTTMEIQQPTFVQTQAYDPSQEMLRDLQMQKQNLLLELRNYEENARIKRHVEEEGDISPGTRVVDSSGQEVGAIPANTQLQTTLYTNLGDEPSVELYVSTSNETLVRCVMIFAEGIFPGESFVVHPRLQEIRSDLTVPLRPSKDVPVDLHIKALVGFRNSQQFHVFELSRTLPRFAMYALLDDNQRRPRNHVACTVNERPQRLAIWLNEQFLMPEDLELADGDTLDVTLGGIRSDGETVSFSMDTKGSLKIHSDTMQMCGDLMQGIGAFFNITDLTSAAEFPDEVTKFMQTLEKVDAMVAAKDQMSADIADHASLVKVLMVRIEESRIFGDMALMRKYLNELNTVNQELLTHHAVRSNNQEELLSHMKYINQTIQRAGRLRLGKHKNDLITACRAAIKNGTVDILPKLIRLGKL